MIFLKKIAFVAENTSTWFLYSDACKDSCSEDVKRFVLNFMILFVEPMAKPTPMNVYSKLKHVALDIMWRRNISAFAVSQSRSQKITCIRYAWLINHLSFDPLKQLDWTKIDHQTLSKTTSHFVSNFFHFFSTTSSFFNRDRLFI